MNVENTLKEQLKHIGIHIGNAVADMAGIARALDQQDYQNKEEIQQAIAAVRTRLNALEQGLDGDALERLQQMADLIENDQGLKDALEAAKVLAQENQGLIEQLQEIDAAINTKVAANDQKIAGLETLTDSIDKLAKENKGVGLALGLRAKALEDRADASEAKITAIETGIEIASINASGSIQEGFDKAIVDNGAGSNIVTIAGEQYEIRI